MSEREESISGIMTIISGLLEKEELRLEVMRTKNGTEFVGIRDCKNGKQYALLRKGDKKDE